MSKGITVEDWTTSGLNVADVSALPTEATPDNSDYVIIVDVSETPDALNKMTRGNFLGSAGLGDVVGPAASVADEVAVYDGTTGKLLKRASASGIAKLTSGVLSAVTAPSGAIVGTTDTQTLSGKTLTLPEINDTSADHQYVFAVSELAADRTVTLPLLTTADEFVFKDHAVTLTNKTLTTPTIGSFANAAHNHTNAAGGAQLTQAALSDATATPGASKIVVADGSGKVDGWVSAASTTVSGIAEAAIASEVNTGTDAARYVSPDALAGSVFGTRIIQVKVFDEATTVTTGDGKVIICIPPEYNGMNLVDADAYVTTVSSSGLPTVMIRNVTDAADMLSTAITIDANEFTSYTAATAPVINGATDDVATGDRIAIDVDGAGTGAKGLGVILSFQLP